jgi:hypothetical protein
VKKEFCQKVKDIEIQFGESKLVKENFFFSFPKHQWMTDKLTI